MKRLVRTGVAVDLLVDIDQYTRVGRAVGLKAGYVRIIA